MPAHDRPASPNADQLRIVAENVRRLREAHKLTLGQLAARSRISKAALSKLESETTNPTLETLAALATGLSATTAELVTPAESPPVHVVRRDEGMEIAGSVLARLVHVRRSPNTTVEVHEMTCLPGHDETSTTHGDGSWEHVFGLAGETRVGPLNEAVVLGAGDYAAYSANRVHGYAAAGEDDARILIFLVVPRIDGS